MNKVNLVISGNVQGVGFRSWAKSKAKSMGITGWVRNRPDGAVEILAEGERGILETLIDECWKGPETSWVENIGISWIESKRIDFPDFTVKHE